MILPHNRITRFIWKIQIKAWHTFLSYFYRKMKTADHKNTDPRLVETKRLMMLELHLDASQSKNCPQADHTLLFEHHETPHSLPPECVTQFWRHQPTMAPFAWQRSQTYSILLHPKLSLFLFSTGEQRPSFGSNIVGLKNNHTNRNHAKQSS